LIAFALGGKWSADKAGFSIVGAHTDSPCLKIKPVSKKEKLGWLQLGVQTYGGGLWHTWFDRDLGIAGRAIVADKNKLESRLVRIRG
jgi:aspartyl aminopeptidase